MAATTKSNKRGKRRSRRIVAIHKPHGILHPRVQKVGPERFGIVSIDCAKARSKWMLCNFYGSILVPPTEVTHSRGHFDAAVAELRHAMATHKLQDLIVAVERTGNYHLPVKRAFADAGFEIRIVHPFATKQFRQPANPGNKTDDTDLAAIFRAAVNGFGLIEPQCDAVSQELQLMARHRRDLVQKRTAVCCQIREHLEAVLPGYAACFDDLWSSSIALEVVRQFPSPDAIQQAGVAGLGRALREAQHRFFQRTLERIVVWAGMAAQRDPMAPTHHRILLELEEDRLAKTRQIHALEREIAKLLVQTPYVLLLSHPGINVVSAGELAGEMGPISNYANHRGITGRAGLFPSRYQSDEVDSADGKLVRCANRTLRAIIMLIAENLILCNHHFRALSAMWKTQGKNPGQCRVSVASRFCRIVFQIVGGRQVFHHPGCRERDYILDKLWTFHREHQTPPAQVLTDLHTAVDQLPQGEYGEEAAPLQAKLEKPGRSRRHKPQPIGDILLLLLARLGVGKLQSESRDQDLS